MLGLHPWKVSGAAPGWADRLEALLGSHRAGLGECGLDFTRKDADRVAQEDAFRFQLRLARALRRPVAIHAVRAWGRLLPILAEEGLPGGTMIHAFSGSPELARTLQAMGVYLTFSGALLDPRRPRLREALRAVDARHLLLETDGSADLEAVLEGASEIRGVAVDDLAAQTWENGRTCFQELLA
jgi:TatD DNase family protein